jgi:hypothetical protein
MLLEDASKVRIVGASSSSMKILALRPALR